MGGIPVRAESLNKQIRRLNDVPEAMINDRTEPTRSFLLMIHESDAPAYSGLRRILAEAPVRASLNPTTKAVFAGILSDRYDTFTLAGNLWLAALRSANPDYQARARQRLVGFIQPAHIPILIDMLKVPGASVQACEVLRDVTGQSFGPAWKTWMDWWKRKKGKVDVSGHVLEVARAQLREAKLHSVDIEKYWYLPEKINDAGIVYSRRSRVEQRIITRWNQWANRDVRRYVNDWGSVKPLFENIVHQRDERVDIFLRELVSDQDFGDYAGIALAWRGDAASLGSVQKAYAQNPTPSLALARGSMGDKKALDDLLQMIQEQRNPLSLNIMDRNARAYADFLRTIGVVPAEQAFQLLTHRNFGFETACTRGEKERAAKLAERWLHKKEKYLVFNKNGSYFSLSSGKKQRLQPG